MMSLFSIVALAAFLQPLINYLVQHLANSRIIIIHSCLQNQDPFVDIKKNSPSFKQCHISNSDGLHICVIDQPSDNFKTLIRNEKACYMPCRHATQRGHKFESRMSLDQLLSFVINIAVSMRCLYVEDKQQLRNDQVKLLV